MSSQDLMHDFRRPVLNPLSKLLVTGLASYEGEKWAKHRRIVNPSFHVEKLKEWESLASKEGSPCLLDVWPSLQHLMADVISRTSFGSSYQEGRKIFELLKEQATLVINALQSVYIPGWRFLPTKVNKRMKKIDKEVKGLLKSIINKREKAIGAGEASKDDLLGALMESKFKDIQGDGKTTSVFLVWTMILLGQSQNWQDRARQEVLQVFGSNKPDFDVLSHLKVLESKSAYQHCSFTVTRNCGGDDANEFNPERFSEGVSKATKSQLSFFPFGGGPRICIGQNFAMMEAKMALSLILLHFDFELSPSYAHAPSAPMIRPQYGALIILHRR
ncbi:putative 11-oxo-beta-amyrin 30-oxidase [Rosa chinensis]|uniref:Putative 11-oxo-beta-amyrin 30-oxidase n=1 Tax=Rosa chinensis TaxID=74649 RepID=A0A2P6Q9F9_ROSCH|nr:putative 11-oxo-beta-amyrin 30-oxidase [Rosa chinensis]